MTHDELQKIFADPIAQDLMTGDAPARLGYIGRDGGPRVVPVGFFWKAPDMVIATATQAPKVAALRANPRVALTIDTMGQPPHILLVRGSAVVEVVDCVPDEFLAASRKYIPVAQWEGFVRQSRDLYKQMARITITPEWAKIIDFEQRLPQAIEHMAQLR